MFWFRLRDPVKVHLTNKEKQVNIKIAIYFSLDTRKKQA